MKIAELATLVGRQFQPGPWLVIDQAHIDAFAQCTGDQQFIHTDPQRALHETSAWIAEGLTLWIAA